MFPGASAQCDEPEALSTPAADRLHSRRPGAARRRGTAAAETAFMRTLAAKRPMAHKGDERKRLACCLHCLHCLQFIEQVDRLLMHQTGSLEARQIWLEFRQGLKIVCRREQIDVRQRRLHTLRTRCIALPADHRIEPDDASTAPCELPHLRG